MSRLLLLCVIAGSLTLSACGTQGPHIVQVRDQDAGRTVTLQRDDQLTIILEGNPTTGYTWEQAAGNVAILKPAGEPTFTPDSQALGAGGEISIPFVAVGTGQTTLTLIYHRSFEPDVAPLKTFTVEIIVT